MVAERVTSRDFDIYPDRTEAIEDIVSPEPTAYVTARWISQEAPLSVFMAGLEKLGIPNGASCEVHPMGAREPYSTSYGQLRQKPPLDGECGLLAVDSGDGTYVWNILALGNTRGAVMAMCEKSPSVERVATLYEATVGFLPDDVRAEVRTRLEAQPSV